MIEPSVLTKRYVAMTVRRFAEASMPSTPVVADGAVAAALRSLADGGSVDDAWREGRRFVECCRRHPSAHTTRLLQDA